MPGARDSASSVSSTGPVGYLHVDDIQESLKVLLDPGGETQRQVSDVGRGKLIATVKDADGNVTGLIQEP